METMDAATAQPPCNLIRKFHTQASNCTILTLPHFHDYLHGLGLAHASLLVVDALHGAVGGCCRKGEREV